ncbi:MFS transporter [Seongchinamella sediminis]|uniref:MFS transporter n=1 Tax=Seongchinamella sediminis TaxID=2283635 RepID=A0A3L7E0V1_9GAMM|nr:MFS transporter [Seongchinamella sediminis]RLQ21871.1 MFS transporter [Seongchinamella sediminis]
MNNNSNAPGAGYALFVLLLAYILSFIDRNVMAVLIGPIRQQFDISDFQYSLLHGFAFSMFYIVLGLPIARLADRHNRKWIITVGVLLWSVMTCLCGLAKSFTTLFLARIGVGVGEAALSPPAYSLLADFFSPDKLPRAMAVYTLGITLGGGLAYIVGGAVYQHFEAAGGVTLPLLGHIQSWQMTFIAVGLPGVIVVALLGAMREPARGATAGMTVQTQHADLAAIGSQLRRHWRAYLGLIGSMSLLAILGYGTMAWFPEFMMRSFGADRATVGSQFGTLFIIAGSLGTLAGGWSVQPLSERGYRDAPLRVVMICALLWLLPATAGPLSPSPGLAMLAAAPIIFFLNAYFGVGIAGVQLITPPQMRAQISALMLFSTNLFGLAFGPSAVALITDFVFADDLALRYSLAILPPVLCTLAAGLAWQGLKDYRVAAGH